MINIPLEQGLKPHLSKYLYQSYTSYDQHSIRTRIETIVYTYLKVVVQFGYDQHSIRTRIETVREIVIVKIKILVMINIPLEQGLKPH